MINVSLVIPVFNETDSIISLLESVEQQTLQPTEVVIVDGESTDDTVFKIQNFIFTKSNYTLLQPGRAMPGRGRNIGTAAAKYHWIAYTDAGIKLDINWLKNLAETANLHKEASIVYGNYHPIVETAFDKAAVINYVSPLRNGENRGKSIASCLVKKEVWNRVEGFPDWRAAEDLIFMEKAEKAGFTFVYCPAAIIHWKLSPDYIRTFKKFDMYTKYNVWAKRGNQWYRGAFQQLLIYAFIVLAACIINWWLLLLIPAWLMVRAVKRIYNHKYQFGIQSIFSPTLITKVTLLSVVIDIAIILGCVKAFIQGGHDWRKKQIKKEN
ncbi:MAG: hypothetical protein RL115_862 [Bacteroidota bacterium]|jgi:glycosyltransferase involved in cell wall biosynthesis